MSSENSIIEEFDNSITNFNFIDTEKNVSVTDVKISDNDLTDVNKIYSYDELKSMNIEDIYKILKNSEFLTFVSPEEIKFKTSLLSCFRKRANYFGITMISSSFIESLRKILLKWNNNLINNKIYENKTLIEKNDLLLNIINFDNNTILRNTLYCPLKIQNKIIFVQYKDLLLKKIEYRIRSFCQIMEDLGAVKISIDFDSSSQKLSKKELILKNQYNEIIAGSVGFVLNKNSEDKKNFNYELNYPENNNYILNKNIIERKIKESKYIIDMETYNSNLEIQYIINSRCEHYIKNYSTIFTIENINSIDNQIKSFLKINNIDYGQEFKMINKTINKTIIKTLVEFIDNDKIFNSLNSNSISFDEKGFKLLINSINIEDFENKGIIKIINFLYSWMEYQLKTENFNIYKKLRKTLDNLARYHKLDEIVDMFKKYFNKNSQWNHFENLVNILLGNTISYDKLGYIVILNKIDNIKFINILINIYYNLEFNNIHTIFPYEINKMIFFNYQYLIEINNLNHYNWYNLLSIGEEINNLGKLNEVSDDEFIKNIYQYIKKFHKYYFYEKYFNPFLENYLNKKYYETKDKTFLNSGFIKMFNVKNLLNYQVNSFEKFENLIENKLKKYKSVLENIINKNFDDYYVNKKLKNYFKKDNYKKIINENFNNIDLTENIINYYNIDFKKEIADYFTFNFLLNNINYGYYDSVKIDIINFTNKFICQLKNLINGEEYFFDLFEINNDIIDKIYKIKNYKSFILLIVNKLNEKKLIIDDKTIDYLKNY